MCCGADRPQVQRSRQRAVSMRGRWFYGRGPGKRMQTNMISAFAAPSRTSRAGEWGTRRLVACETLPQAVRLGHLDRNTQQRARPSTRRFPHTHGRSHALADISVRESTCCERIAAVNAMRALSLADGGGDRARTSTPDPKRQHHKLARLLLAMRRTRDEQNVKRSAAKGHVARVLESGWILVDGLAS